MSEFRFCPACGSKNELQYSFCPKCGQSLKSLNSTQASQQPRQPDIPPFIPGKRRNDYGDDDSIAADNYDHVPRNILHLDFEIKGTEYAQAKETIGDIFKQGQVMGPTNIERRDYNPTFGRDPVKDAQLIMQEGKAVNPEQKQHGFKSTDIN